MMLECQVGMQSDTQARKAQAILQRYGTVIPAGFSGKYTPRRRGAAIYCRQKGLVNPLQTCWRKTTFPFYLCGMCVMHSD